MDDSREKGGGDDGHDPEVDTDEMDEVRLSGMTNGRVVSIMCVFW